jgi:hypothetical protein
VNPPSIRIGDISCVLRIFIWNCEIRFSSHRLCDLEALIGGDLAEGLYGA